MRPRLLTFDIFGTVLDWRLGLHESLRRRGLALSDAAFESVIDCQSKLEAGRYRPYAEIVAMSLARIAGIDPETARAVGEEAGRWPLFEDSRVALRRLMRAATCAATTNSDRSHATDVQRQLGFRLDAWISAEDARSYKPDRALWRYAASKLGVPFGRHWWHVSAYADYDLGTAGELGLTRVFVLRAHARPGPADYRVRNLMDLARLVERTL